MKHHGTWSGDRSTVPPFHPPDDPRRPTTAANGPTRHSTGRE
ncbi:hypothetical protein [Azospirillum largimobile]